MDITVFIYTTDKQYAINKTKEILNILEMKDIFQTVAEPYWKFSDMYVTDTQILTNIYPKEELLKKIADVWWKHSDSKGTSDTTPDNVIKISDVAMIDIQQSTPPSYRDDDNGNLILIEWIELQDRFSELDSKLELIKSLGSDVYYVVRKNYFIENEEYPFYQPENLVYISNHSYTYGNLVVNQGIEDGQAFEWYYVDNIELLKEYIEINNNFCDIMVMKKQSTNFLYYISEYHFMAAVKDYQGDFLKKIQQGGLKN